MALIELYAALYQEYKRILTVRQYEVLRLKEVERLSGKQIAYKLGISQSAVSRYLTQGKMKILKEIDQERTDNGEEDNT